MNMRVLFAIHGPADEGTAVYRAVWHRIEALRRLGHDADLVAAGELRGRAPARLDPLRLAPALARRRLDRYDAVIFHSHLGWAFHAARPWLDPARRLVTITSFHGLEPIYYSALSQEFARSGRRFSLGFRALHGGVVPRLLRFSCRQSDAVFCLNSAEADYLASHGWAAPDRIHRMSNGVEAECFVEHTPPAHARRLLFIGQWLPAKGIRYLVDAFTAVAEREDATLACMGTGASADAVLRMFPEPVRPRVTVQPRVSRATLVHALAAADLFVFPTLSEGFSNALLEAMAAGLPIVTTEAGAASDILRDGVNARIVPRADSEAIARAVVTLAADAEARRHLGAAAKATAREYTQERVDAKFIDCLMRVMDWRPSPVAQGWMRGRHVAG